MKHKDNQYALPRQEENKVSHSPSPDTIENPIELFDTYTPTEIKLANFLVRCQGRGIPITDSASFIGRLLGMSTSSVKKAKATLMASGLITSYQRTCFSRAVVRVSTYFLKPWVRACLSYFLPALKLIPLVSLLSVNLEALAKKQITSQVRYIKPRLRRNYTHTNIKVCIKDINSTLSSSVTNDERQEPHLPFANSSQSVKKDCSMSGILENVMDKLGQDQHIEPPKTSPRDMLESEVFQITEIALTKWGQIRFCAFPAHIITKARLSFDSTLTGQAAFNALYFLALTHCRKEGLEPDWRRVQYLATHFKQPNNAPMILNPSPLSIPEDDTQISRDVTQTPRSPQKDRATSMYKPAEDTHKREAYIPYQEEEKDKRPFEAIYIAYFTVEDGYKASGNPLGFPNPYKARYENYLTEALSSTNVPRETMEAELYDMYLKQKGSK